MVASARSTKGKSPARAAGIGAQAVVTGLNAPAAFTFAPDGRIFYGELQSGQIRVYNPSDGSNTLFYQVTNLSSQGEQGLLGLAVDPKYPRKPFVYAYATRNGKRLKDEILKLRDSAGAGTLSKIIWRSNTTAGVYHDGGRIMFGSDGKLYAVQGEAHDSSNSQDLSNDAGKILRMTRNGSVPRGNPFPGSLIWSYGHRNSFGFTFDPLTGNLWETENGPECNDEVNLIREGRNYGWGRSETCSTPPSPPQNTNQDGPSPVLPKLWFTPTIAPVGAAFCVGCGLTQSEGTLFFGSYNDDDISRGVMTAQRKGIVSATVVYRHPASIFSVERGPDQALYFSSADGGIYKLVNT